MVVGTVLSSTNDELYYTVERYGASKRDGGTGTKWRCNCPHNAYRHKRCKHIDAIQKALSGLDQPGVTLWE